MASNAPSTEVSSQDEKWPLSARILRRLSRSPEVEDYAGGTQNHVGEHALDFLLRTIPGFREIICGKTVLDYGCGAGDQVLAMKTAGAKHVVGFDPFPKFPRDRPEGVEFRADPPTGNFDVVLNSSSFEHFADPEREFIRMRELTRGRLVITWAEPWYSHHGSICCFRSARCFSCVRCTGRTARADMRRRVSAAR